ncbi:MAG: hypothetical protein M3Z04_16125 [Chloroflexota bacterium]|nr:hypothetical protein [Chloroflexota bacterium]
MLPLPSATIAAPPVVPAPPGVPVAMPQTGAPLPLAPLAGLLVFGSVGLLGLGRLLRRYAARPKPAG